MFISDEVFSQLSYKSQVDLFIKNNCDTSYLKKMCVEARCSYAEQTTNNLHLIGMAADKNDRVRYWVARNPNTPIDTIELLANDVHPSIRMFAKRHPKYKEQTKTIQITNKQKEALKSLIASASDSCLQELSELFR